MFKELSLCIMNGVRLIELIYIVVLNIVTCFIFKVEVEMLNDMFICLFLIF